MRLKKASVRTRIAVAATLAVGVVLIAAGFVLISVVRSSLERPIAGEAKVRAADVVTLSSSSGVLPSTIPPLPAPWPTLVQVVDSRGDVIAASRELEGEPPLLVPTSSRREPTGSTYIVFKEHRQHWQLNAVTANVEGADVTVVVATSLAQAERSTRLVEIALAIGIPVLLLLVATLGWILVGRALRPVEDLRREVAGYDRSTGGRRVPEPPTDDEIARLARTLNALLDRLDEANGRQRRFIADASHELRSPVANIRAAMEITLAHPDSTPWLEVAADVLDQNARMGRLVDDLLLLGRAEADPTTRRNEQVELHAIIDAAIASQVDMRVPVRSHAATAVYVTGDAGQLERVVENLVANAQRHAATAVDVSVSRHGRWAVIDVTDDGPGVAAADRERVFQRFVRLDSDRSPRGGGTGLGLAIVAEVVAAHGGTVSVTDAHPGAVFTVRLPVAS